MTGLGPNSKSLAVQLAADETVFAAWSGIPDPLTLEALAATEFDSVLLDMQHGGHSEESVLRCLAPVIAHGKPGIVRIPVGRFDMASRALDYGAQAVVAPMINSADDARQFAAAMKYPPLGERSWGVGIASARDGQTDNTKRLREGNGETLAFAMIETRRAYDALDAILDVPGIDAVFIGPSDFSIGWTNGKAVDPRLEDMAGAVQEVVKKARAAGKYAGLYLADMSDAGRMRELGIQFFGFAPEAQLMNIGAASLLAKAKASIG
ncbi:MAG: 2,4-dihydroxyhept-2-ene-1,7-dioic acid aldolase [Rhizobiaceae bacterium]|nr:2,4-dihydroxyhept-2-ene-1,7-dioic acid aldolase [Rhizobiaceae bacterium]